MPRYEYKCKKCDRNYEVTHGVHESLEKCRYCGGAVRRVFHPVGLVFKGSGFYSTDARGSKAKPPEPTELEKETVKKTATPSDEKSGKKEANSEVKPGGSTAETSKK